MKKKVFIIIAVALLLVIFPLLSLDFGKGKKVAEAGESVEKSATLIASTNPAPAPSIIAEVPRATTQIVATKIPSKPDSIKSEVKASVSESKEFTSSELIKVEPAPVKMLDANMSKEEEKTEAASVPSIDKSMPKVGMEVDGYFAPLIRFTRNGTVAIGGHVAVNLFIVPKFSIAPYIHGEYFLYPLGSNTGLLGGLEMELEAGINITFPVYENGDFKLKFGFDLGYYMQWLTYNSSISTKAHLTYNGLMIRPTFTIDFTKVWGMPIGIGLFYQVTAIIPYSDYNGFGVMITL